MATKKNGRTSAKNTKSNKKAAEPKKESMMKRQAAAIILLASAVLMMFILIIEGQVVWKFLHEFLFGIFGIAAFAVPFLLGYIAFMLALNRSRRSPAAISIMSAGLLLAVCSAIDVFTNSVENVSFITYIVDTYKVSSTISKGGIFGALLGYPLSYILGSVGAKILIIVILIVVIMLVTRTTISSVIEAFSKLVRKIKEHRAAREEYDGYGEYDEGYSDEPAPKQTSNYTGVYDEEVKPVRTKPKKAFGIGKKQKNTKGAKFNIDIPLDDTNNAANSEYGYEPPKDETDNLAHNPKRDRLIDDYTGKSSGKNADFPAANDDSINMTESTEPADESTVPPESNDKNAAKSDEKSGRKARRNKGAMADSVDDLPATGITVEVDTDYKLPTFDLLNITKNDNAKLTEAETSNKAELLVNTLKSFGVETRLVGISQGPSVTRFELQPAAGVKISKITSLSNDIALNLASSGVRIEAPIPNKAAVGIEVPNKNRSSVGIRELLQSPVYMKAKSKLCCVLGKDITGNIITMDLAKMPHLLVAGTTGSGKSVCLNSMIISILFKARPDEVKLIMIDPKSVEFTGYNGIPHLLVPVVTNPQKAAGALGWAVNEMLKRYQTFSMHNVRNISGYNDLRKTDESLDFMPQIVIFIDELSDLMMAAPNEVEDSICRLAQMARAAGMHMVIATQSPRVDVITGLIKANIPSRIALTVSNAMDSRVIIDTTGAEKLIGYGDMLYSPVGMNKPLRVQGCFVSDEEVNTVVNYIKNQGEESEYDSEVIEEMEKQAAAAAEKKKGGDSSDSDSGGIEGDERLSEAVELVCRVGKASTTLLQTKLGLGYARAARIVDQMEEYGVIGPFEGSKPRKVLMTYNQWLEKMNGGAVQEQIPTAEPTDEGIESIDEDDEDDGDIPPFDEE